MIDLNQPLYSLTVSQFQEILRAESKRPEPPKSEMPKYLSPQELADLIKKKITTVYQNHHNGLIPGAIKVGSRLLFDTEIILKWIEAGALPTFNEKVKTIKERTKL